MDTETTKIPMQPFGLVPSYSSSNAYTLILAEINGRRKLPIIISEHEAQAIALELENIKPIRPLTHDLLRSIIDTFHIIVDEIFIERFAEGIFYSRIFLTTEATHTNVDSRTSDAIVLALKYQVPIYADKNVLETASVIFEDIENDEEQKDANDFSDFSDSELRKFLTEAEEKEEYEAASKILSELNRRKNPRKKNEQ